MVAEVVALREACTGEATKESKECCDNDQGGGSCLPTRGRSETERNCGTNAYQRPYYHATRTENVSA